MPVIETRNLTKTYGKARGIRNVNLSVEAGDFYGFIGPNGAGKSTTIRTLLGLISPTSGEGLIHGKSNPKGVDLINVGYMASEAIFYNGMKVSDIISYSAKLRGKDCSEYSKELCQRLQLDCTRKINQLSLGNRKKVAIVCAMQHKPDLYIFDEPTSGLDPLMQREFFDILKEENQRGATIFLSSHVLSEVQHYCNKAAIIREGEIIAVNTMEELAKTSAKKVVLYGIENLPETISGKSIEISSDKVSFVYKGDIKPLIEEIAKLDIEDVSISELELEDVFMHYYEGEA